MKKLQQLSAATTLLFVLSLSAMAGHIHTDAVPPPLPPPASATANEPDAISTDEIQNSPESETFVAEITLRFLQLLSVF